MSRVYKNILWLGIAALLIFMPLARGTVKLWSMTPALLLIYFLLFIWLWNVNNTKKSSAYRKNFVDVFIFLFLALALISASFSIYRHDSAYALLWVLGCIGVYYLIINNFDAFIQKRLIGLVLCMGAGLSLYGLLQYIGIFNHSWWSPGELLASTYVNHNHFAGYLELAIPLAIGVLGDYKPGRFNLRLLLVISVILMGTAFIFTQSRAGWVSLAIALFVMNMALVRRGALNKKSLFIFVIVAGIIFSFFYFSQKELLSHIHTITSVVGKDKEPSDASRLQMWQAAIKMVQDRPLLGTGIGAFDQGFYRFRPQGFDVRAVYAHNDYLHMAAEMGLLAPLIMIGLLICVIRKGLKAGSSLVVLGCATGILSLGLHGVVDFNFHIPANMLLLIVYVAFVMSPNEQGERINHA